MILRTIQRARASLLMAVSVFALTLIAGTADAQTYVDRVVPNSTIDRYLRTLELAGRASTEQMHFRSEATGTWRIGAHHPWEGRLGATRATDDARLYARGSQFVSRNPAYPSAGNDGRLWQGNGINSATTANVGFWSPILQAQLATTFTVSENRDYPLLETTRGDGFGNYRSSPDVPQRFGSDPVVSYGLDGTEIRAAYRRVTAGLGWRPVWLGPTEHNALIQSTHAAPYFSINAGFDPVQTRIGALEAQLILGWTRESAYFDDDPENDLSYNLLFTAAYQPRFLPGLTVGLNRQIRARDDDLLSALATMGTWEMSSQFGNDELDQRASITFDWTMPRSGFSAYGEWAKNDYSSNWRIIVREPEHSVAYTLGVTQAIETWSETLMRFSFEHTQLVWSRDYTLGIGGGGTWYGNGSVPQGSTHLGQVLGAAIGSGSDSQALRGDWYTRWGSVGLEMRRIARDKDYLYGNPDNYWFVNDGPIAYRRQNVEMSYMMRGSYWAGPWMLEAELGYVENINWNWIEFNDRGGIRAAVSVSRSW